MLADPARHRGAGRWQPQALPSREINFTPARVLLQDFTGVPAVVDLAAMRDAMRAWAATRAHQPAAAGRARHRPLGAGRRVRHAHGLPHNVEREYERNQERYAFLRWGQQALRNFRVVPPGTGIVHQVNLEYLARVVFHTDGGGGAAAGVSGHAGRHRLAHHDGQRLGVLGWGVGGIEAEAAMLGQPCPC
jgi:aconitate hydratase